MFVKCNISFFVKEQFIRVVSYVYYLFGFDCFVVVVQFIFVKDDCFQICNIIIFGSIYFYCYWNEVRCCKFNFMDNLNFSEVVLKFCVGYSWEFNGFWCYIY